MNINLNHFIHFIYISCFIKNDIGNVEILMNTNDFYKKIRLL